MAEGETAWWKSGELDESFRYPPAEPLGTSWGSYLISLPTTARLADRFSERKGETKSKPSKETIGSGENAELAQDKSSCQPRPSFLSPEFANSISVALQRAVEALVSCEIECSALRHASDVVAKLQEGTTDKDGSDTQDLLLKKSMEVTVEALVSQAKTVAEYATSLKRTAEMLAKNQRQFAKDQHHIQQTLEAAFSRLSTQQKLLEKKSHLSSKPFQGITRHKTFTEGLREGQHRLALQQARKEHSRLEKTLLQQQRDLRRLEYEHKTTKSELAVEQYNTEQLNKKLATFGLPTKQMSKGLKERLYRQNQRLEQLVQQMEVSKKKLAKTGCQIGATDSPSHPVPDEKLLKLPRNNTTSRHNPDTLLSFTSSNREQRLPKLVGHHNSDATKLHRQFSCSELMELAAFSSPETAREVIHWLEKEGAISDK